MKRFSLYLAVFFLLMLVLGPMYIFKEYTGRGKLDKVGDRLHYQTANSTRIWGSDWEQQQNSLLEMAAAEQDVKLLLLPAEDWQTAVEASYLMAPPVSAIPLLVQKDELSRPQRLTQRLDELPIPRRNIGMLLLPAGVPADVAKTLQKEIELPVQAMTPGGLSGNVIIVPDSDPALAMPAVTWSALTGDRVIIDTDGEPAAELVSGSKDVNVYLLGTEQFVRQLYGSIKGTGRLARIIGESAVDTALAFAEYFDPETEFGWWYGRETPEGGKNFFLLRKDNWQGAIGAGMLAARGRFGPVLLTEKEQLPPPVENYLWRTGPEWFATPTEGPYNHTFIMGDLGEISFPVQARADFAEEIRTYMMQGSQGTSALDGLVLAWLALAAASAVWLWSHISTRRTNMSPYMKLGWVLEGLVLGPLAVYAYYLCYRGYSHQVTQAQFIRPFWVQAVSATLSTLSFGAPAMILTGFFFTVRGLPVVELDGPLFILGNPMVISMITSYLAGLAVLAFLFVPLMLRFNEHSLYRDTVKDNFLVVLISMSGISVGMLPAMWWLMMEYLPMMPEESNLLWWGSMYAATVLGAFTGLLFNWPLVAHGRKQGDM